METLVDTVVARFTAEEFPAGVPRVAGNPVIIAIGTIAERALRSPLLHRRLEVAGVRPARLEPYLDPSVLDSPVSFSAALVLSPFKREVAPRCQRLTPSAAATGVVDTILATPEGRLGVNTNSHAASAALGRLVGDTPPARVLLAGTGASARSVAAGVLRSFPAAILGIVGRSPAGTAALVREIGKATMVTEPAALGADTVINTTTVGESDDTATFGFDLDSAFGPGVRYFDLNNRTSALQQRALAAGCVTMSGILMQILTNALRVSLLAR